MEQLYNYQMPSASNVDDQLETVARSTRGASKHRRDQINLEIQRLRDLLPLNSCVKDRLFQLQVMSLACIYIRKQTYLPHVVQTCEKPIYPSIFPPSQTPKELDTYKAMRGFMVMITNDGKMLYISDNASEFLGYSVEEIMCQGDSIYDLVDIRDHALLQQQLTSGPQSVFQNQFSQDSAFVCRMNLSKTVKRQMNCYKFIMLEGRYIHPAEYYKTLNIMTDNQSTISPIFAAFCTPLISPKNAESLLRGSTEVFHCQHEMDLKFLDFDSIAMEYLGFLLEDLKSVSLYELVHPDQLPILAEMHQTLCKERDGSVMGLIRIKNKAKNWIWLHSVMSIKASNLPVENCQLQISGIYQQVSQEQANSLLESPWIYSTKHYNIYRGEMQKDTDFGIASSPESMHNVQRFGEKLDPGMEQVSVEIPHASKTQFPYHQFDPNNNSDPNNNEKHRDSLWNLDSPDSNTILSAAAKSICLDQLQQLCASDFFNNGALPDLGRQELEDFFRQVEEQPASTSEPNNNNNFIKNESEFELKKGIKREYDDQTAHKWWMSTQNWQNPNNKLPPVSSLGTSFDFHPTAQTKRHRSSIQFAPKIEESFLNLQENNNGTGRWNENCYQVFINEKNHRKHESWNGIQTG